MLTQIHLAGSIPASHQTCAILDNRPILSVIETNFRCLTQRASHICFLKHLFLFQIPQFYTKQNSRYYFIFRRVLLATMDVISVFIS